MGANVVWQSRFGGMWRMRERERLRGLSGVGRKRLWGNDGGGVSFNVWAGNKTSFMAGLECRPNIL